MTTIDKIRAEIDKRYAEYRAKMKTDDFTYYEGMADALDLFEQFLDTLEEPASEELEQEMDDYIGKHFHTRFDETLEVGCDPLKTADFVAIARHFAEWQKDKDTEAVIIAEDRGFLKGADWARAEMMEGAVEGTVIELGETYKDLSLSVNAKELNQVLQPLGVGDGDKVKIIIVKEDGK